MRTLLVVPMFLAACGYDPTMGPGGDDDDDNPPVDPSPPVDEGCPDGAAGAACVLELYDAAVGCEPAAVEAFRAELEQREGPLWANGRALFRSATPKAVAGTFNDWSTTSIVTAAFCDTDLVIAVGTVATGYHQYKLNEGATWTLDPDNPAFAFDDFSGNLDGRNSVLNTSDSGRGHLVTFGETCSEALGNCREVTAYLPPGYDALATKDTRYPVLFMHDGQNIFSDHDCCFGHTGWEIDVALDLEIAEGRVAPIVVIGAAHSTARNSEYGLDAAAAAAFMDFQVTELQPQALAKVRWNNERVGVGGSSLGGLIAMDLALAYPETYSAAVSLSGAFWPGMESGDALRDRLPTYGKQAVAIYLDHGGSITNNSDGAADSVEVRDDLIGLGWQRSDSPACTASPSTLCYHSEPGATHDELAWKARTWRFLRFLYPAP